jgi:hypothetical protein
VGNKSTGLVCMGAKLSSPSIFPHRQTHRHLHKGGHKQCNVSLNISDADAIIWIAINARIWPAPDAIIDHPAVSNNVYTASPAGPAGPADPASPAGPTSQDFCHNIHHQRAGRARILCSPSSHWKGKAY